MGMFGFAPSWAPESVPKESPEMARVVESVFLCLY